MGFVRDLNREGVYNLEITEDHFMKGHSKKVSFFIYNSFNLNQLDNFQSDFGINVMIINTQTFASSLKKDGSNTKIEIADEQIY